MHGTAAFVSYGCSPTHCWGQRDSKDSRSFSHLEASSACLSKHCQNSSRAPQQAFLSSIVGADIFATDLATHGGSSAAGPDAALPAAPRHRRKGLPERRGGRGPRAPPSPTPPGPARRRSRCRKRHRAAEERRGAFPSAQAQPRRPRGEIGGRAGRPAPAREPWSPWGRSARRPSEAWSGRAFPNASRLQRFPPHRLFRGAFPRLRPLGRRRASRGSAKGALKTLVVLGFAGMQHRCAHPLKIGFSWRTLSLSQADNKSKEEGLVYCSGRKIYPCTGGKIIPEVWGQAGWAPGELSPAATPGTKAVPAVLVKEHPGANSCLFYLRVRGLSSWQSVPVAKELIVSLSTLATWKCGVVLQF